MTRGFPDRLDLPPEVVRIAERLESAGFETWCVGGALRDALLEDPHADVDLATAATPDVVRSLFQQSVPVGIEFGTVGVLDANRTLHEVTTFRRDVSTDGRRAVVAFGASLEEDLARRDFTINAIAYHPIRHEWRDPFQGREDLQRGLVRAVGEPTERFREDYLRILRAVRFAARLGFAIDPPTWEAACAESGGLRGLSAERVRDEWFKSLRTARSLDHLTALWRDVGARANWLPELAPEYPGASPAPEPRDPVVLTALLCRSPDAVLARLRGSNQEIARAEALAHAEADPEANDTVTVRRWLSRTGDAAPDLRLLARYRTGADPPWGPVLDGIRERGEAVTRAGLAINGEDLAAIGVPRGPRMGQVLDALLDRVVEDPSLNERHGLLDVARGLDP